MYPRSQNLSFIPLEEKIYVFRLGVPRVSVKFLLLGRRSPSAGSDLVQEPTG